MQQTATTPLQAPTATPSRAWRLLAYLPYIAFVVWMVYKQRVGLISSGITPGPDMLIATVGAILVITPWAFVARGRTRILLVALLDLVLTFIMFADIVYFRQFGDLVSVASLRFAGQLGTVADSVLALLKRSDMLLWADIPLIALLALIPRQAADNWLARLQQGGPKLRPALAATLAGALMVGGVAFFDPMLSAKYYGHSMVASRMGLINYHIFDIGNYASRLALRSVPSGPAVRQVNGWFAEHGSPKPAAAPGFGVARGKNVIMVQVESLQAFTLGLTVNGQEVTPNLNRLAKESMNFTDFYSQTGQGVTSDADLLGNCSLFPTRTGAVYYDYAGNDFRCMPEVIREHGYKAVALQGMPPDFWNLASVYPHVGFEKYYNIKDGYTLDEKIGIGLSDESFLRQTVQHLKSLPEPYYAFPVTLTSHGPFNFPELPRELNLGALEGTEAGHYLHAVHYTDKALGHFVDRLKQEGILDNTVLLLYGDHAGVFRQSTGMADLLQIGEEDEVGWTRLEKRIPFMVRLPGGAMAREMPHAAGQVDIAPTLAGLLGIDVNESQAYFMGRNLLEQPVGPVPFYTGSAFSDDLLFWSRDVNPALGKCYSRSTGAEVAIDTCSALAQDAAERLEISRLMVSRNLIPQMMKSK